MAELDLNLHLPSLAELNRQCKVAVVEYLSSEDLEEIKGQKPKKESEKAVLIRQKAMRQESQVAGIGNGVRKRYSQIQAILNDREMSKLLDSSINFSYLMTTKNVIPAVITEVNGSLDLAKDRQSAISTRKSWRIDQPSQLTTGTPNWRTYLAETNFRFPKQRKRFGYFTPHNSKERAIWADGFCLGYKAGFAQANDVFMNQLSKLRRDYLGMLRYIELEQKGVISKPVVTETRIGVVSNGTWVQIDKRDVRITDDSTFNDSSEWEMENAIK